MAWPFLWQVSYNHLKIKPIQFSKSEAGSEMALPCLNTSFLKAIIDERLWKKLENSVSVWIVNGRLVRSAFDIDFTEGGHDYVYEFVPGNEVWIDDAIEEKERGYVLLHELHERNRMAEGLPYSEAHSESSRLEFRCRHHPDELHNALEAEGWA